MQIEDLDAPLIGAFLDHLEDQRGNSVRTRNTRLAAIHSLFRFAALQHPEHAALIARVLAIPPKRYDRAVVCFLDGEEIDGAARRPGPPAGGSAVATTRCCWSPSRPGCGSPS